jgi:Lrp/AsnC family transcriptional regulator, leucine-responsive regulatory protein
VTDELVAIDQLDREILRILRSDARIGWSELGARIRLSPNAAADRVRRLVRTGVIRRFTAEVDQSKLGRSLEAVIDVRIDSHDRAASERFRDGALECEEVTWLAHVTGRTDFQVHAACNGTAGLNDLLRRFREDFGALETLTTVVLERSR